MATKKTTKKTTKKAASRGRAKKATTKARAAAKAKQSDKSDRPKRVSGLDLAAKVLKSSKEPLTVKAIAERVIAAGWKTNGKTPAATLNAAIHREINLKGAESRFKKTDWGLFTVGSSIRWATGRVTTIIPACCG